MTAAAADFTLRCYFKGDADTFKVIIPSFKDIGDLKEQVYTKILNPSSGYHAKDLILIKPQTDVCLELVENGQYRPDTSDRQLKARELICEVWPEGPSHGKLHVFITPPNVQSLTVLGKRRHDADLQDISAGEVWLQFRRTWWGDPGKKVDAFRERTSSSFFLHIEQEEVRMSFKLDYDYLFVREEYLLFAKRCRNLRPDTTFLGCLILGQPGIGKSLFLLYLLIDCLARKEVVLLTTYYHTTYLFDAAGVWKYDTKKGLPEDSDRIFSLVDAPIQLVPIPPKVTELTHPKTLYVAALSPNPKRYHEHSKSAVPIWWMAPWSNGDLYKLFKKVPIGPPLAKEIHDEDYVRKVIFKTGPCPRDIIRYILSPDSITGEINEAIDATGPYDVAKAVKDNTYLSQTASHKVVLVTRVGPVLETSHDHDHKVVNIKSEFIYDKMLIWSNRLDEEERERWYSICRRFGAPGAGLAGFLFEGYAIRHTSMLFPTTNKNPFIRFARMNRGVIKSRTMPIRFVYEEKNTTSKLVVLQDAERKFKLVFNFCPSGVPLAVAGGTTSDAPWARRQHFPYDKIEDICINESFYYCPNTHNNPLFDAFFFSVKDQRVVVWILQMTIARKHKGVSSGFDLVRSLRERASDTWRQHEVEVKYVLVVPHSNATYDVEWNFAAEFEEHKGEVYVQFLNVSAFQGDEGKIEDILEVQPKEEAMKGETMEDVVMEDATT